MKETEEKQKEKEGVEITDKVEDSFRELKTLKEEQKELQRNKSLSNLFFLVIFSFFCLVVIVTMGAVTLAPLFDTIISSTGLTLTMSLFIVVVVLSITLIVSILCSLIIIRKLFISLESNKKAE